MALTAINFAGFAAGGVLHETSLEGEFNNIYNNGEDLAWPATKAKDLDGQGLIIDADGDTVLRSVADDEVGLFLNSSQQVLRIFATAATAKNGFEIAITNSGQSPFMRSYAGGGDTVLDFPIRPLGSGAVGLQGETGNWILRGVDPGTSQGANYIQITTGSAGTGATIAAAGSDTNIDLRLIPKGAGDLVLDGLRWPTADGSLNQSIKTDGAGKLSFGSVQGMTFLATIVADSALTVDFTALDSTYDHYHIDVFGVRPSSAGAGGNFCCRLSNDGGTTYLAGATDYQWMAHGQNSGGAVFEKDTADTLINFEVLNMSTASERNYELDIYSPAVASAATNIRYRTINAETANPMKILEGGARRPARESNVAIRFLMNNNNTFSGRFTYYGIQKS